MPPLDERAFPDATVAELFTYHPSSTNQQARYEVLRGAARKFAAAIVELCPESNDRTDALRKLRECVMTANASIALEKARA